MKAILLFAGLLLLSATAASAQIVETLKLDDVIRKALENSPELIGALHTVRALEHGIPQAQALPDPVVSVGWAGNPAPFSLQNGDPSSSRNLTVSEQFPYPGKRKLQGQIASKGTEAAQADYEAVQRRVIAEVKAAYFEYYYSDKAIQATEQNKELLEKLSKIAEARYRVGKAMQQDVLRSQIEISMLTEKLTMLEAARDTARARLNTYMLRTPEADLAPAEELKPVALRYSLDELYALAAQHNTDAERNTRMVERGQLEVSMAQRQYRPDIGVSYMYQQRAGQQDMNGLTFSINVPVFYRGKQRQAVAQAEEELLSAEKMRDNRLNEIRFELKRDYAAAKASEKLVTLYSQGIVPQSSLALESSMSAYQVGSLDFQSMIANFSTLLNYETDYYRRVADYNNAVAQIELLTGDCVTAPVEGRMP